MNKRQMFRGFLFAAALAVQVNTTSAGPASTNEIVVGLKTLNDDVIGYVAENGEPRSVSAPAGTDLLKLIATNCGSANARRSYTLLFIAANAANADIQAKRLVTTRDAVFTLPACLYADESAATVTTTDAGPQWQEPKLVTGSKETEEIQLPRQNIDFDRLSKDSLAKGGLPRDLSTTSDDPVPPIDSKRLQDRTLENQYKELIGTTLATVHSGSFALDDSTASMARRVETTLRTQDVSSSNKIDDYSRIPTGQPVTLSAFAPGKYVFTVKSGLDPSAVAVGFPVASLEAGSDIARVSDYEPYFAIPQSGMGIEGEIKIDCAATDGKPWPVDYKEISRVLKLRQIANRPAKAGRLLILDTGFPPSEVGVTPFRKELFIRKTASAIDSENQEYLWSATRPPNYFFEGMKNSDHGIAVLSLALGGIDILQSGFLTSDLFPGGFLIMMSDYTASQNRLALNGAGVVSTLTGTNWGRVEVDVVNMSLRFKAATDAGNTKSNVLNNHDVLYVFAAGNDDPKGHDLGIKPDVIPAKWGGDSSPNVVTVGSVDAADNYSSFANFSSEFVDLAAPGCDVPVFGWNAATHAIKKTTLSGTSMSAPLVSFAANLLRGDYREIGRLKARLLVSGRYSAKLDGRVRSSRVLDVASALAVPFDVYRDKDGKVYYGHLIWPSLGKGINGALVTRDEVRQISSYNPANSTLQIAYGDANSATDVDFRSTPLLHGELTNIQFQEAVEQGNSLGLGAIHNLDIRDIESVTFCQTNECYW